MEKFRLTSGFNEVFLERSGRKIWVKFCKNFPLNSCYVSRRLKGGEPARRGRSEAEKLISFAVTIRHSILYRIHQETVPYIYVFVQP
jgi:hypothetical protein